MAAKFSFAIAAGVCAGYFVTMGPAVAIGVKAGFPGCAIEWWSSVWGGERGALTNLFGKQGVGGESLFQLFGKGFDCRCQLLICGGKRCDTVTVVGGGEG